MSNLDDFFKKRDKKKKTTKSKFPTLDTDEFVKKLEATSIVSSAIDGEEQDIEVNNENLTNQPAPNDHLDEDWKPFDSDENKDYTGLRINIQNWKVEDQDAINEGAIYDNEKKTNCPWGAPTSQTKKDDDNQDNENEKETEIKPEIENNNNSNNKNETPEPSQIKSTPSEPTSKTETTTSSTGAYVPPALRRQQNESSNTTEIKQQTTDSSSKYVPPYLRNKTSNDTSSAIPTTSVNYRRPNKSQPNLNDTSEFPSLDAGVEPASNDKLTNGTNETKFEMPKKSGKIEQKSSKNMIDLENKFTALSSANN